jgi:hypothetical protein
MNQTTRHGTALILLLAVMTLIAILAFSLMNFVSDQRGWARAKHIESLLKQSLLTGRSHAMAVVEQSVALNQPTTLATTQPWIAAFRSTAPAWPADADVATRNANRTAWLAANGGTTAANLWRFEAGLASPENSSQAPADGWADGYASTDGTGRWITVAWLDRDFRPVAKTKASLQLRYAVSIIDQSGLLLGNKARYAHLTDGSKRLTAQYDVVDKAGTLTGFPTPLTLAGKQARTVTTRAWEDVPATSAQPCPITDLPIGITDDTLGYDAVRYNTWRPIPADHSFAANGLASFGFGIDDSRGGTWEDGFEVVSGGSPAGWYLNPLTGRTKMYHVRKPGNLPDAWRSQGFHRVELKYWQFSKRFLDFLPFEQNPHPVAAAAANPVKTANKGAVVDPANRHTAALLLRVQVTPDAADPKNVPTKDVPVDPYDGDGGLVGRWNRDLADMVNQLDLSNWWSMQQRMRLHRVGNESGVGVPTVPNGADGLTQCWTPFGSTVGWFDAVAGDAVRAKNDYEMRYQWTVNANTAPRRVVEGLFRLAIPEHSDCSPESADPTPYNTWIAQAAATFANAVRSAPATSEATLLTKLGACASGDQLRMLQTLVRGGAPAGVGVPWLGAGPRAEFRVRDASAASDPAHPCVILHGRHKKRFWMAGPTNDRPDAAFRFRISDDTGTITATNQEIAVQTDVGAVADGQPAFGAETVTLDATTGKWTADPAGLFTRVWILPADVGKVTGDVRRLVIEYPGITWVVGTSRWYRIAIRAQLNDLDVPASSQDLSMDMVFHPDPDRSGPAAGSGTWDSDVPYADYENPLQYRLLSGNGAIIW